MDLQAQGQCFSALEQCESSLKVIDEYLCAYCLSHQKFTCDMDLRCQSHNDVHITNCGRKRHCDKCLKLNGRCCMVMDFFS